VGNKRPALAGGARGKVQGFSAASRLNMLRAVHAIDRQGVVERFFGTLTVPRGEGTWAGMEKHRRNWLKRFDRRWPGAAFIVWKKELHKSGTVHLHALIFWVREAPRVKEFRAWNDDAWADVVKSSNPWHRRVGCRVERMHSWNGVGHYCAKYLAKDQEHVSEGTGRIWGIHNRELVPVSIDVQRLPGAAGVRVKRALRKLQARRREKWWVKVGGVWNRLREIKGGHSIGQQVSIARAAGLRVKRRRPRCLRRRLVNVWGAEEGTPNLELVSQEWTCDAPSLHFVRESTARGLLAWALGRWLWELEVEHQLPF
jgi:hypothetical protein